MIHSIEQQVELLMRRTQFGDARTKQVMAHELAERLAEREPLRVYLGVDPTAPDLHLGHAVALTKLADFQKLGHHCTLLMGDFTALIGDPSDKDKTRPQLTPEAVQANVETYNAQAFKLLDPVKTVICYNSEWHREMTFEDLISMASPFTVAQFLERDNFARRYAGGDPIHLHEFFYALMQGYDAVALRADVQLGGADQTFNILAGRKLQQRGGQRPQVMLTNPMLPGTDGQIKMSKSLGNAIPIQAEPEDMYGKLMSLPDEAMPVYFELLTMLEAEEVQEIFKMLQSGKRHPRDVKMLMARNIVSRFHGQRLAEQAEAHFVSVFQRRHLPPDMPSHTINCATSMVDLLVTLQLAQSKSQARRLIQQGGVRLDDDKVSDIDMIIEPQAGPHILRVGKRHFVQLLG